MALSIVTFNNLRLALPKWNQAQSFCSSCVCAISMRNKVCDELGLPRPPKRPLTPYFKFAVDMKDQIPAGSSFNERVSIIMGKWECLPETEKEKYSKLYDDGMAKFGDELQQYKMDIGSDQLEKIRYLSQQKKLSNKLKQERKKEILSKKETVETLGKPKMPTSGYILYIQDMRSKRDKSESGFYRRAGSIWRSMTEAEQAKYKEPVKKKMDVYKAQLFEWEKKMVAMGRNDLVRKTILASLTKDENEAAQLKTEAQE